MWLPPSMEQKARAQAVQYEQQLRASNELKGLLDGWNARLKEIDPYLELIKASHNAQLLDLRPGFYHLLRHCPGAPPYLTVLEGPNGEFREPDSSLFETLAQGDMWSERTMREQDKMARRAREAAVRDRERETADRRREIAERLDSLGRTSITVPR